MYLAFVEHTVEGKKQRVACINIRKKKTVTNHTTKLFKNMMEYCGHKKNKINFDSKDNYYRIGCRNVSHCHPIQYYDHQDDNILPIYEMTLVLKPFTKVEPA